MANVPCGKRGVNPVANPMENPMTIHEQHPRFFEQMELEIEMNGIGVDRFRSRINAAHEKGRGGDTQVSRNIVRAGIAPLADRIQEYLDEAYSGRPGPRSLAARHLKGMDLEAVAYLTLRSTLTEYLQKHRPPYMLRIAATIGKDIEHEARFSAFLKSAPGLYEKVKQSAQDGNEAHIAKVLTFAMNKFDIPWTPWPRGERLHIGTTLLELVKEATGLIDIVQGRNSGFGQAAADQYVIKMRPSAEEWFTKSMEAHEKLVPWRMPTIIPPKPWDTVTGGGYYSQGVFDPMKLVVGMRKPQADALKDAQLGAVYSAINAVQNTAWVVNREIAELALVLIDQNSGIASLPPVDDYPAPVRPPNIDTDEEVLKSWKWDARAVHERNTKLRHERLSVRATLSVARRFLNETTIHFPHSLDFRGRMYSLPLGINPQGSDLEKALVKFAEGKPLGEDGEFWLAVHGANTFGVDKVSFDERIQWVEDNLQKITSVAIDPTADLWWTEADKPWCFLAFCQEWFRYKSDPETFKSHIPIALDGSCNGLQHFSAMLKDPVGGSAVNLTPSDKPQDIYQRVADEALGKLKLYTNMEGMDEQKQRWAYAWRHFGIDRKMTKRPVMVLPYGGTPRSCLKYVEEAVRDKIAGGKEHNFGDELNTAVAFLASVIWDSIGDVVIAARDAMDWLQRAARVLAKKNYPVIWTTPSGFVVRQSYASLKKRRLKTKIGGSIIKAVTYEETNTLDKTKQATSISPNFVHSLDAAAMILTIDRLVSLGVTCFAMIHDSYGVHACDAMLLSITLRQVFVEIYETDPLTQFRDEIVSRYPDVEEDLPPLPKKGNLDLTQVMLSDYFFA